MPGLLDDFIQQFTGASGGSAESAAAQFHDRFTSTDAKDSEFDNNTYQQAAAQHLQQLPDDQFNAAARNAATQTPPAERAGLLQSVLGALASGGGMGGAGALGGAGGLGALAGMLGLGSTDPHQMDQNDFAKVMNYARKERPDVIQQTVQEKPWFMKAMGNPIVMGALTMAATQLLNSRRHQ